MKPGDLVRFTRSHCRQPGFTYCSDWWGIILSTYPKLMVSWTCPLSQFIANYGESNVHATLEIISEGG